MAANPMVERLTPLDVLLMPRTYVTMLLTFRTTEATSAVSQALQRGLDNLFNQLPWLSGRVFPVTQAQGQRLTLEILWTTNESPPSLIDKGSISAAYESLSAQGMPPAAIPPDVWPAPSMIDDSLFSRGAPVFAASIFRFENNQGVGLCICIHHSAVDAAGFAEVLRLWAHGVTGVGSPYSGPVDGRLGRLSKSLSTDLDAVSTLSSESIFASHQEYSNTPPALPTSFSPCMSKVYSIPIAQINAVKKLLAEYMSTMPTANTVLCALIWSSITRVRMHHNTSLADNSSRLVTAVNGRRRISEQFSTPESPYLGNVVLYALAELAVADSPTSFDRASGQLLATVCDNITRSQSSDRIDSRYIAEVYSLANNIDDYRTIFPGWDLFSSRDLTIASWIDLDLYGLDYGTVLENPDFIRVSHTEAVDGVGIILPRRRTHDEVIDVMLMLRKDDMDVLDQDSTWTALLK